MRRLGVLDKGKEIIVNLIRDYLANREDVLFAYIHGSFVGEGGFRDLDVALYVWEEKIPISILQYELEMEVDLGLLLSSKGISLPVDVRVLNNAPLSFQYKVIKKGLPVMIKREREKVEFEERVISRYLDFDHHRRTYLREVLGIEV